MQIAFHFISTSMKLTNAFSQSQFIFFITTSLSKSTLKLHGSFIIKALLSNQQPLCVIFYRLGKSNSDFILKCSKFVLHFPFRLEHYCQRQKVMKYQNISYRNNLKLNLVSKLHKIFQYCIRISAMILVFQSI